MTSVQSPINFNTRTCINRDDFEPLQFIGHFDRADSGTTATVRNTAKTAQVTFDTRPNGPHIQGGPLPDSSLYRFVQLHFHWSDSNCTGTEHTVEGIRFSMEAHALYYNTKYASYEEAANNKPDGLAVVAFFIKASGPTDCPQFEKVVKGVKEVVRAYSRANIEPGQLV